MRSGIAGDTGAAGAIGTFARLRRLIVVFTRYDEFRAI
jgi:hypothetical protein